MEEEHGCDVPREIGHYRHIISPAVLLKERMFDQGFISVRDIPDDLAMDGARDTVLQLEVHLGNGVLWVHGGLGDITCEESQFVFWYVCVAAW